MKFIKRWPFKGRRGAGLVDSNEQLGVDEAPAAERSYMNSLATCEFAERSLELQGRLCSKAQIRGKPISTLADVEFKVYSQWGEDGIIEWLVSHVEPANSSFIEFGVENFVEANCRFLMLNRNWKGLVLDGSDENISYIRQHEMYWKHDLTAVSAFITAENINELVTDAGFAGNVGILSIDVDGNDYWILKSLRVVNAAIIVCELNPIFGDLHAVTVPYDPSFRRFDKHYSGLYFGASLQAVISCAEGKGYRFLGTNSNGINAFFVRHDLAGRVLSLVETSKAYASRHRDSRDLDGNLSYVGGQKRYELIADLPVFDVCSGKTLPLRELGNAYSEAWLSQL